MARIFTAKFRRHLTLNTYAQAASATLIANDQILSMADDWHRFDVEGLLDQTLWVCECETSEIRSICKYNVCDISIVSLLINLSPIN